MRARYDRVSMRQTTIRAGGGSRYSYSNVVQSRCNRSVERSRYAESLSDEREQ
jgi:hypothetical protein